jgi:hypothetical protein
MTPTVVSIHVAPGRRLQTKSVPSAEAEAGVGLVGDRYHGSRHRHLTRQAPGRPRSGSHPARVPGGPGAHQAQRHHHGR